jgi:competence protein ComEA
VHLTPQERLALTVVALLLCAGAAGRVMAEGALPHKDRRAGVETGGEALVRPPLAAAEAKAEEERVRRMPLRAGERLDPSTASAVELQRLPRVGPALAARIVAHRETHGPFRTLADFDAVPGVGPALLAAAAPHLALEPGPAASPAAGPVGAVRGGGAAAPSRAAGSAAALLPLDVNRASAEELRALPGIGPALAARIVAHREEHGPFRAAAELERVRGIGPKLRERIEPLLRFGT